MTRAKGNLSLVIPTDTTMSNRTTASWRDQLRMAPSPRPRTTTFYAQIKERKVCQWTLSYLAAAWMLLQLLDVLSDIWGFSSSLQQLVSVTLGLALLPVLVLAWYHGERGRQRVCRTEAILLTTLITGSTLVLWSLFAGS